MIFLSVLSASRGCDVGPAERLIGNSLSTRTLIVSELAICVTNNNLGERNNTGSAERINISAPSREDHDLLSEGFGHW
jgi:hypothetical protein